MPTKFKQRCEMCPVEDNRVKSRFRTMFDAYLCDECAREAYYRFKQAQQGPTDESIATDGEEDLYPDELADD